MKNRSNTLCTLFVLIVATSFSSVQSMGRENSTSSLGSMGGDWEDVTQIEQQTKQQEQRKTPDIFSSPIIFSDYQPSLSKTAQKAVSLTGDLVPEDITLSFNTESQQSSTNLESRETNYSCSSCSSSSSSEPSSTTTSALSSFTSASLIAATMGSVYMETSPSTQSLPIEVIIDSIESPKNLHRRITPETTDTQDNQKKLHEKDFKVMKEAKTDYRYVAPPTTPKRSTQQTTSTQSAPSKDNKKQNEQSKKTLWHKIKQCCSCPCYPKEIKQ